MSLRALQGPTGGGAPVGGSGTTNTIPRWTGPSTLGDSVITQSGSFIGIGTASPGFKFVVADTVAGVVTSEIRNDSTNSAATARLRFTTQGGESWIEAFRNAGGALTFATLSTERARIDSSGNVGIGTASPGAILHTLGTGTSTGIFATSSANAWMELRRSTSTTLGYIGTGSGLVTGGAAADLAFRCESGNLLFSTVATERARIDSAGRWYVGVSAVVAPASGGIWAIINQPGAAGGQEWHNSSASPGGAAIIPTQNRATWYVYQNAVGSEAYSQSCVFTPTGIDLTGASATHGLKLPATPGNPDTQTLDAYQEIGTGTPAEIALTLTCGTSGTITVNAASSKARVTRVGNKVIGHGRIVVSSVSAPLGRLSCTLTGCPQPFTFFVCETRTNDTTGVPSGNIIVGTSDTSATPIVYFDRYSPNTRNDDAAANIQAGTTIVFSFSYSV